MPQHHEILARLLQNRLVGILRANSGELLVDVCRALIAGGMHCIEITMTVPGALRILEQARDELGDQMLLGAGSVLDPETARLVILAGADYIVAPNTNVEVIQLAKRYGKPIIPGAFTPTEIIHAWQAGADIVKLFPSDPIGPAYLKAIKGPLPQIRIMPTGGVSLETMADFFNAGACAVGIGSTLLKKEWLDHKNLAAIEAEARKYVELERSLRGGC